MDFCHRAATGQCAVVHHILIFVLEPGGGNLGLGSGNDFVGAFAPGLRPELLPTGMARRVPAGSKLIFQMHYTPNGARRSKIAAIWASSSPIRRR